jgi:hypothetical protein
MTAPRFVRWQPLLAAPEIIRKPVGVRAWADFARELDAVMPLVRESLDEERRADQWQAASLLAARTSATLVTRDPLPQWPVGQAGASVTVLCAYDAWRAYVTEAREHEQVPWQVTETGVYVVEVDAGLDLWLVAHGPADDPGLPAVILPTDPDTTPTAPVPLEDMAGWAIPGGPGAPTQRVPGTTDPGAALVAIDAALAAHYSPGGSL